MDEIEGRIRRGASLVHVWQDVGGLPIVPLDIFFPYDIKVDERQRRFDAGRREFHGGRR